MMLRNLEWEIWGKESHKRKLLGNHISECLTSTSDFLNFYELNDKYREFAESLCYYHDLGKLKSEWNVNNKNNPPHSPYSALLLFDKSGELEKYPLLFLPLFILRHHGNLKRVDDNDVLRIKNEAPESEKEKIEDKIENWKRNLYKIASKLDIASKVNLVDCYGLFKLADILSANDISNFRLEKPDKNIEDLKSWLLDKIKKKGVRLRDKALHMQLDLKKINKNLLLRAPTGWGKTAASLSYALGKGSRIIYVLPTITSIKSFYDDLSTLFGKGNVGEFFYYADVESMKREENDFKELMLSSYFAKPIIITTLDQLLLTFLQVGRYFMKRPHLRNSVIILDEVHTFSQTMLHIFSYFSEKFSDLYNLKFCVMSATFPSELKNYFKDLYDRVNGETEELWLNDEFRRKKRVMYKIKEDVDILEITDEIVKLYSSERKPFRVAIICNTVEKSQKVFKKLYELNEFNKLNINMELLHSRFIYKHRCNKEDKITEWIKNGKDFILVSTQVIEVSLDVSFDFMITECAPLGALVQRFGRVNRYNDRTKRTNVWITFPEELNIENNNYPYEKENVLWTWKFLKDLEGNALKNELQLIEEYDKMTSISERKMDEIYDCLNCLWEKNTSFLYSWQVSNEFAQKLLKFRDEITTLVIPRIYEEEVRRLYKQMKEEVSYTDKKQIFMKIKEYTVPVPIWMDKKILCEDGFPIADLYYNEYGVRKRSE
jgi:CRISPR-associated endonuclease/helicase Cas3